METSLSALYDVLRLKKDLNRHSTVNLWHLHVGRQS